MRISFWNGWRGSSMKPGGTCPITFVEVFAEVNPGYKVLTLTFLNFMVEIDFGKEKSVDIFKAVNLDD